MSFRGTLKQTDGGVSPFMFGLLLGMGIFSMYSLQLARKELVAQQAKNAARDKAKAEDIAQAMEFSLLTETRSTYSDDISLQRALGYTTTADGKTRGGDNVLVVERDAGEGTFGNRDKRVAITATDDTLYRSKVYRTGSADELSRLQQNNQTDDAKAQTVVTFDSGLVRDRQVRTSVQNMNALAEYVYSFYAGHMRFPTGSEFDELQRTVNLHDVWGQEFSYSRASEDKATLEFTTPWNYTRTLNLDLNDDNNGETSLAEQRPKTTTVSATDIVSATHSN